MLAVTEAVAVHNWLSLYLRFAAEGVLHRFAAEGVLHRIAAEGVLNRIAAEGILNSIAAVCARMLECTLIVRLSLLRSATESGNRFHLDGAPT